MSAGRFRRGISMRTETQSCGIVLFWLLVSFYEVVQNSADRGFFLDHRPGAFGKNFYLRCFAPLCKTETKNSLRGDRDVGGMV